MVMVLQSAVRGWGEPERQQTLGHVGMWGEYYSPKALGIWKALGATIPWEGVRRLRRRRRQGSAAPTPSSSKGHAALS